MTPRLSSKLYLLIRYGVIEVFYSLLFLAASTNPSSPTVALVLRVVALKILVHHLLAFMPFAVQLPPPEVQQSLA